MLTMKCQVLVDWLTFSVKETDPAAVIKNYLGLDPALFQDAGYGLLGYNRVLRFSDICVCYEPRENDFFRDMGVCVSMSGNGCRTFETMSKLTFDGARDKQGMSSTAFSVLFQLLAADETANISRIDVACDAPSSDFRIRIYDKALEQGEDGHWVRVELVLRKKNANAFVEQMTNAESVGKLAAQVINDKFAFTTPTSPAVPCVAGGRSLWMNWSLSGWWPGASSSTGWNRSRTGWKPRWAPHWQLSSELWAGLT